VPGGPSHLIRRFFEVASARPLSRDERAAVGSWLTPALSDLFFSQQPADQRHGYRAGASVAAAGYRAPDVVAAALLHDVGKRHAGFGALGRSVASVMILLSLPLSERMLTYRDHGIVAARELGRAGAPPLVVDFALHHHGRRPETIAEDVWDVLAAADEPVKPRVRSQRPIP